MLVMDQVVEKGETQVIEIGGLKNPRSFEPTNLFKITTYDSDGVSLIDSGYDKNMQNTKAG